MTDKLKPMPMQSDEPNPFILRSYDGKNVVAARKGCAVHVFGEKEWRSKCKSSQSVAITVKGEPATTIEYEGRGKFVGREPVNLIQQAAESIKSSAAEYADAQRVREEFSIVSHLGSRADLDSAMMVVEAYAATRAATAEAELAKAREVIAELECALKICSAGSVTKKGIKNAALQSARAFMEGR